MKELIAALKTCISELEAYEGTNTFMPNREMARLHSIKVSTEAINKAKNIELPKIRSPKTLQEAIRNAITADPGLEIQDRYYDIIKDFIAQKFSIAYLEIEQWKNNAGDKDPDKIIKFLFEKLVKREEPNDGGTD